MSVTFLPNMKINSWNNTWSANPEIKAVVSTLEDIIYVIKYAETNRKRIKAYGSFWSFTDVATSSDIMISMKNIRRLLLIKSKYGTTGNSPFSKDVLNSHRTLIHVESGATMKDLIHYSSIARGALPTAGGGSNGQTLAGMLGSGSHGGYYYNGTFSDIVKAIHLVGAGGKQFWIERSGQNSVTTDSSLYEMPYWHNDEHHEIIRDDNIFEAVIISLGRMGVIYSLVIELSDGYNLEENTFQLPWGYVKTHLLGKTVETLFESVKDSTNFSNLYYLDLSLPLVDNGLCYLTARQKIDIEVGNTPNYDLRCDILDELIFSHSDWFGILHGDESQLGYRLDKARSEKGNSEVKAITEFVFSKQFSARKKFGSWAHVMWNNEIDLKVYSSEYAFDATNSTFVEFVNEARQYASNPYIPGLINMRFLKKTNTKLGIQRYTETVHVEISAPVGYSPAISYMKNVDKAARKYGGIPNWGQQHNISAKEIRAIYSDSYLSWIKTLLKLSKSGSSKIFSNKFTVKRGLEPILNQSILLFS